MVSVKIDSNVNRWYRNFEKKLNVLKEDVTREPGTLAKIGAERGRVLAPKDTGALVNAISWKTNNKNKKGSDALMFVRSVQNTKYVGKRGRVPRYAAIHYHSPLGAPWMPRTGNAHWFRQVVTELRQRYGVRVRGHIQKFVS